MANKAYASRLKQTSATDDTGGYDILGHLHDAGTFVATGQMPVRATAGATGNTLQDKIALEEVKARLKSQNVNPLNDQLKQAQIAQANAEVESYKQPLPPSLIRVGKSVVNNPDYIDPIEQLKVDAAQSKQQEAQMAKENADKSMKESAQSTIDTIETVKKGKNFFGFAGKVPSIPYLTGDYGKRKEWENNVNNLLSNKVVEVMQNMKRVSKTGATGFGQLNKSELDLLKNASTKITRDLTPDLAVKYLDELENVNKKLLSGNANSESNQPSNTNNDPLGVL